MVLAELRKRLYREEGRRETQRAWEAWNERRLAAEREGLPFDEPPLSLNRTSGENGR
ncbi:MAG: hypothetical protein OXI54_07350 [Chloroflexota bacterium]|nr:hypothetical protein [Chloroflexota bacterium]